MARSAMPISRMQWWMRPGPSRAWAMAKPVPSSPIRFAAGTRAPSKTTSAWPPWSWSSYPYTVMARRTSTPGVSRGTRIIDCWRRGSEPSGSDLPITMKILQSGFMAPEMNHLRPVTTYASPSRSMRVSMFVASEEATSGSVIAKAERISPVSSGSSHCFFCSSLANCASSSMFPVSGAAQLVAVGARCGLRPVISASGAYWRLVSPAPYSASGRKRFHRPWRRASAFSSPKTAGVSQGEASRARCSAATGSAG